MTENKAKVTEVIDGDTIKCEIEVKLFGRRITYHDVKVRMLGVNTPERGVRGYNEAKSHTHERLMGKDIVLHSDHNDDVFDRLLAVVYVDDVNFNEELLAKGLAVVYKRK